MEKAIKNKVSKAVVPAIDVMFQALRFSHIIFFCFCENYFSILLLDSLTGMYYYLL